MDCSYGLVKILIGLLDFFLFWGLIVVCWFEPIYLFFLF